MISFTPTRATLDLGYADDSSSTRTQITLTGLGQPTDLLIFNPDTANIAVVGAGIDELEVDAIVPIGPGTGAGLIVPPNTQIIYHIPQQYTSTLWIAVAGVSATGNVYITPGQAQ